MCKSAVTLFELPFEGSFLSNGGDVGISQGVTFDTGYLGLGALFNDVDTLFYATEDNIYLGQGALEFWLKPLWNGNDEQSYVFFEIGQEWFNRMRVMKDGANNFRFMIWSPTEEYDAAFNVADWEANEWHHVRVTWTSNEMSLYLDGDLKDVQQGIDLPGYLAPTINIGFTAIEEHKANAVIDEFKIFSNP